MIPIGIPHELIQIPDGGAVYHWRKIRTTGHTTDFRGTVTYCLGISIRHQVFFDGTRTCPNGTTPQSASWHIILIDVGPIEQ